MLLYTDIVNGQYSNVNALCTFPCILKSLLPLSPSLSLNFSQFLSVSPYLDSHQV